MRVSIISVYAFAICGSIPVVTAGQVLEKYTFPRRPLILGEKTRRDAFDIIDHVVGLEKRAAAPQQSTTGQSSPTSSAKSTSASGEPFNEQNFNTSTTNACGGALGSLENVVNPTGLAACYNIPFLDISSGTFEADIRLYQVTTPTGEFSGFSWTDLMLGVTIPNAIISDPHRMPTASPAGQRNMSMVQDLRHIGKLNPLLQLANLSPEELRVLLIPNITISGVRPGDKRLVATTLSSDMLSYVSGQLASPNSVPVNITVPEANALLPAVVAKATPFVLPGTTLGIFPLGLIITCIWTGLFVFAVGYGTIERVQFRNHFRRRLQLAAAQSGKIG